MTEKSEMSPIYTLEPQWKDSSQNVWIATTLNLSRNFSKFKFPQKLDKAKSHQVVALGFDALKTSPELKNPKLFKAEETGPLEKEYLVEHFLSSDGFHQAHGGEGFVIDDSGQFLAVLNIQNHLNLQIIDTDQEIEKSWSRLIKIEEHIGKSLDFAYHSRFGFLTSFPQISGTGFTLSLFLHIPAVIHSGELPDLLEKEKEDEIEISGIQGSPTEMIGDILVVKNSCTIGLAEEFILTSLRMWATRAVVAEVSLRKKLKDSKDVHLINKVARALGLLTHSYQLETLEALNAFSLVKLGIELGWIETKEKLNLNEIFFNCRRAHLLKMLEKKVEVPQLPRKRAEYLHEIAKNLNLVV